MGWRMSFLLAVLVDIVGLLIFLIFGTGELQDWAKEEEPQQTMGEIVRSLCKSCSSFASQLGTTVTSAFDFVAAPKRLSYAIFVYQLFIFQLMRCAECRQYEAQNH